MIPKRAAYQRRGRFALLGSAVIFVIAQAAAGLALDWHGIAVRFPSAARVLNSAPRGERGPDVIFLGTSRSQDLRADVATALVRLAYPEAGAIEVYNAAVPGGDPIAEDYVLKRLIDQGSRPRLALVEVSPDTVNHYNKLFALHCHRQIVWLNIPEYFWDVCRSGELKKLVASRLVPLYTYRGEIVAQTCLAAASALAPPSKPSPCTVVDPAVALGEKAYVEALLQAPPSPLSEAEVQACQEAVEFNSQRLSHFRPGGTTAAALERLLRRCRDNHIDVILVGAPCSTFFQTNITPEIDAAYTSYIGGLTQTYGCRFINYRDALPNQFFRDMVHYNAFGGRAFTCKLTREVIIPWLSARQPRYAKR